MSQAPSDFNEMDGKHGNVQSAQEEGGLADVTKRFQELAESLPQPFFETDTAGNLVYVNRKGLELFGYTMEDFNQGLNVLTLVSPLDRAIAGENFRRVLQGRLHQGNEYTAVRKDGSEFPIAIYSSPLEENGQVLGVRGLALDLSKIKRAEDERIILDSKFKAFYDQASHLAGILDLDGVLLETNKAARDFIGLDASKFVGKLFWETPWWAHSLEIQTRLRESVTRAALGEYVQFETTHVNAAGELRQIDFSLKPVLDSTGRVVYLIPEGRDITTRKRNEEALRLSEERYREIFNATSEAIFVHDLNTGQILDVNDTMLSMFGYDSREEVLQSEYDGGDAQVKGFTESEARSLVRLAGQGQSQVFEWLSRKRSGELFWTEITLHRSLIAGVLQVLAVVRDISERKLAEAERDKLQAQLLQSQKLESIGRLAGGVAHDFNNMLGAIIGYVELSLRHDAMDPMLRGYLEQIQLAANRSAELTRQLLAFARKQTITPRVLDLNDTVAGMLKMLQRLIGENIELNWRPAGGLWSVNLDPSQVNQILMNLCVNARDAIVENGRISIETSNADFSELDCENSPASRPGQFVMLAVRDNGSGMDAETQLQVFEPFFTTKAAGQGTGLGLSTVYGIVRQNDGFIQMESAPGVGTHLRIYIPRHKGSTGAADDLQPGDPPVARGETILVVEDEPAILRMSQAMLSSLGYEVLTAPTPDVAIQLAAKHSGRIHLLLTDVVMPGMNGRIMADRIQALRPDLTCLFMSGYTADVVGHSGVLEVGVNFIHKPFTMNDLALRLREILDRGRGGLSPLPMP